MLPQTGDAPKQPWDIQAAVGQHEHRPAEVESRPQPRRQAQPFTAPGVLSARWQDDSGYQGRTAAIDYADYQDHKALAQGRRVDGQHLLRAPPL
jgi:hypothetical protein